MYGLEVAWESALPNSTIILDGKGRADPMQKQTENTELASLLSK